MAHRYLQSNELVRVGIRTNGDSLPRCSDDLVGGDVVDAAAVLVEMEGWATAET